MRDVAKVNCWGDKRTPAPCAYLPLEWSHTLRDWEHGRKEPDATACAYLKVIGRNPSAVAEALSAKMSD
jgi:hypothetical protein